MSILSLVLLLALQDKPTPETKPAEPAKSEAGIVKQETAVPAQPKPLSFFCETFPFQWNKLQPLSIDLDGLKITSIAIGKREPSSKLFQGPDYGSRALLLVTNTSKRARTPGFAIAVFDKEGRLLGVANGGAKIGNVSPGVTETFDLGFFQVKDRLPKGDHYMLSVELRD